MYSTMNSRLREKRRRPPLICNSTPHYGSAQTPGSARPRCLAKVYLLSTGDASPWPTPGKPLPHLGQSLGSPSAPRAFPELLLDKFSCSTPTLTGQSVQKPLAHTDHSCVIILMLFNVLVVMPTYRQETPLGQKPHIIFLLFSLVSIRTFKLFI